MTVASQPPLRPGAVHQRELADPGPLSLPPWVRSYVDETDPEIVSSTPAQSVEVAQSARHSLVTVRIHGAATLDALSLQRQTVEAYRWIAKLLGELPACEPIRFWNFIPKIGANLGEMLRYMVFNAGRFAAYHEWFGGVEAFDRLVATATGVGHTAEDLVIHALAADRPGVHIMNSRQRPPRCYSPCYGAFPPCFARATLIERTARTGWDVLIGGTAAVRGQRSIAVGDPRGQTLETSRNLAQLVRIAESTERPGIRPPSCRPADEWRRFRSLRVYFRRPADEPVIRTMVIRRFPHLSDIEFLRADICRPELLVEIEGTAVVGGETAP